MLPLLNFRVIWKEITTNTKLFRSLETKKPYVNCFDGPKQIAVQQSLT